MGLNIPQGFNIPQGACTRISGEESNWHETSSMAQLARGSAMIAEPLIKPVVTQGYICLASDPFFSALAPFAAS